MSMAPTLEPRRWTGKPVRAALLRAVVYASPLAASVVFVHYASQVVPAPVGSLWLFLSWWLGLSTLATVVLVALDRLLRRLLPLAALLKLSLVFPDQAPSRFKVAMRSGSTERLEEKIHAAKAAAKTDTPSTAAARLLELVAALNVHDRLTRGHCERVRAYAVMIGGELGLSKDDLDLLNWAALLHDVGKLRVPTEILTKVGPPSHREWEVLHQHPQFGEELVEPIRGWLGTWTSAVGFHHERWDGNGYPHELAGEAIPLAGRIVAVADAFDVMTSARSYKEAGVAPDARKELARCAGTQFDPHVVRAFLNVSLRRMRFVMGPLSWLAHAPLLARLPLTPAMGTLAGAFTVAAGSAAGGFVSTPAVATAAAPVKPPAHVGQRRHEHAPTVVAGRLVTLAPYGHERPAAAAPAPAPSGAATPPALVLPTPGAAAPAPPQPAPSAAVPVEPPIRNHAPTFVSAGDQSVFEDGGPQRVQWATAISPGPPSEWGQTVSFSASNDNQALFSAQPALSSSGLLSYTPAPAQSGSAVVTVVAKDDGGTANGGQDTTTVTFTITIVHINQHPTFIAAGNQSVTMDAGPQTVQWATSIAPGPPSESGQTVSFSTSNDNNALFGAQPALGSSGVLSYTPAPGRSGSATVSVTAKDDGGTANGGHNTTTATFTITVTVGHVNQPPTFAAAGNQTVLEDAGAQSVQWATAISPGPPSESGQTVSFSTSNDNAALFSTQPGLGSSGLLTYRPAADANGTATVTVIAHDDGGTAYGGHDATASTFTITVTPVNDAPTIAAISNQTVTEDDGTQSVSATTFAPGPGNENSQTLATTTTTDHPAYFDLAGQPTVDTAGTLTYTPAVGATGVATVTVTAQDNGGTANGGHDATTSTFTITITPLPPLAGDDSYSTTLGTSLHIAAPGVLANDADPNSVTLNAVPATNVATSAGGTASIQADGTFDYTPPFSLSPFNDTVTYQVIDGNGQTATATITISVTILASSSNTLYLDTSGLSSDVWNLVGSPVASASPVPDLDGDNHPGRTISNSDGKAQVSEAQKQQAWAYTTGLLGLSLHGPLTLHLTAVTDNFDTGKPEGIALLVYDCPPGSATISTTLCTLIGWNYVWFPVWNSTAAYATHDIAAAIDTNVLPNRQLRIRVLVTGHKLWIPLVGPYGSSIDYTG
jgi:hypothetical protein